MANHTDGLSRRAMIGAAAGGAAIAAAGPAHADLGALNRKNVLITGTSSGFGRLTALHLADHGATVFATMRNMRGGARPEARSLVDAARDKPGKLILIEIDVTKPEQVKAGIARAEEMAGGALDAIVSNAGIGIGAPVELHDEQAMRLQFDTNVFGGLRVARAALPAMRARGRGVILPVSSQLGRIVLPNIGAYCATKFALEAAFEAMAYELAPMGVEICIVQPGGYPTQIWESGKRLTDAMVARATPEAQTAYALHIAQTAGFQTSPRTTDPMDVPRAIAEVIALPAGTRPLRRPVHPNSQAMEAANAALSQIQDRVMGEGPYAAWRKAVAQ